VAREVGRLTALDVSRAKKLGYPGDDGGLYLQISSNRATVFRFRDGQKLREIGLGPCYTIALATGHGARVP